MGVRPRDDRDDDQPLPPGRALLAEDVLGSTALSGLPIALLTLAVMLRRGRTA